MKAWLESILEFIWSPAVEGAKAGEIQSRLIAHDPQSFMGHVVEQSDGSFLYQPICLLEPPIRFYIRTEREMIPDAIRRERAERQFENMVRYEEHFHHRRNFTNCAIESITYEPLLDYGEALKEKRCLR